MRFKIQTIITLLFLICNSYSRTNNEFIQGELQNQKKWLSKSVFKSGYIIDNKKDTIKTELLLFKKSYKMNAFLFCVIKDAYDSIQIITAENILEYRIGEIVYKKAKVGNEHFFIKEILTGEVTLYERESIPSDYKFEYYLKKKNQPGYLEICPNESHFKIIGERNSSYNRDSNNNNGLIFVSDNSIERFKLFVNDYFRACEKVRNMVNAEIYSINDIPAIVRAYNEMFVNN